MKSRSTNKSIKIIAALVIIMLAVLSACGNTQATTTSGVKSETTASTTQKEAAATKAITTKKETTALTTIQTTASTTVQSTTVPTTAEAIYTTETTTEKPFSVTSKKEEESTTEPRSAEYKRLRAKLDKELNKKDFSKQADTIFIDTFERLYENYPTWQHGYRDLPSREEYITENFINIIKYIYDVEYYVAGTKKAIELEEEGNGFAGTTFDENYNLIVSITAKKAGKADIKERNDDIEGFYHEITHCKQKDIMISKSDYFDKDEDVKDIYIEGGATFHMKFTYPLKSEEFGSWSIEDKKGNYMIEYVKDNCIGYLVDLNAYEKLVYLVGYTTMDKVEKGKISLSELEKTVAKKYGQQQACEFFQTMKEWYVKYNESYKGDEIYNLAIEFEKQFLGFVEQDIDALKTQKQAKKYKPIYDFYMTKNLPIVTALKTNKDITKKTFNISALDKKLNEKLSKAE